MWDKSFISLLPSELPEGHVLNEVLWKQTKGDGFFDQKVWSIRLKFYGNFKLLGNIEDVGDAGNGSFIKVMAWIKNVFFVQTFSYPKFTISLNIFKKSKPVKET